MPFTVYTADGRTHPIAAGFIAVFGLLFVGAGLAIGLLHWRDLTTYTGRATGVVIDFHTRISTGKSHGPSYAPVVRFTTANGEPEQFTSSLATNPPRFQIGQPVPVAYDPANPNHATIDSFLDNWIAPLMFGGPGLIVFLMGLTLARARPQAATSLHSRQAA